MFGVGSPMERLLPSVVLRRMVTGFLLPLLAWGAMGRSVDFGGTVPGDGYMTMDALLGEVVTTFTLVTGLCIFIGFRGLRRRILHRMAGSH